MKSLKTYILLWSTQSLSELGSGMTSYALILWLYLDSGSALKTALLSICSYAPYVAMSIFAGSLTERLNRKKAARLPSPMNTQFLVRLRSVAPSLDTSAKMI